MTTTVTGKNQITIPSSVATAYKLKPGSQIEWLPGNAPDEIRCRIVPDPATLAHSLRGAGRRHRQRKGGDPLAELLKERDSDGKRKACL